MMKKEFVCIVCPSSCRLTVEEVEGKITVTGNVCKRGYDHGVKEFTEPVRMLTTTVAIKNAHISRLPVISNGEIPKAKINECLETLYQIVVDVPIQCGETILANICDTGIDICASRSISKKGDE